MNSICIFGDSTAWGAWDEEKGGWPNRLWLDLANKNHEVFLYNLSVSGGTTETILQRFESEARMREANVLVFQSGGNDAMRLNRDGNSVVSKEQFVVNLKKIIERAKLITPRIYFVGFKRCDETKTLPVSWGEFYYNNIDLQIYNEMMFRVCREYGIPHLNIFDLLDESDLDDGLHPNAKGHEKIYQSVKRMFQEEGLML